MSSHRDQSRRLRPFTCSYWLIVTTAMLLVLTGDILALPPVAASLALAVGPIRIWPGRHAFSWEADVDTANGIATSKEVMKASRRSSIARHFICTKPVPTVTSTAVVTMFPSSSDTHRDTNNVHDVWTLVTQRLEQYPQWLVRGAVTLGLFQAAPLPGGGWSLQDRFFGINFLSFARPQSSRFSFYKTVSTRDGAILQTREGDCTVVLPIIGGLLAQNDNNNAGKGCLWFRLQHNESTEETKLVTEIRGYNPWLIGSIQPVPLYRKLLYLSTQSIVHAYVMWRFHRHCLHSAYKPMPAEEQPAFARSNDVAKSLH
jgi:hypothetical protein